MAGGGDIGGAIVRTAESDRGHPRRRDRHGEIQRAIGVEPRHALPFPPRAPHAAFAVNGGAVRIAEALVVAEQAAVGNRRRHGVEVIGVNDLRRGIGHIQSPLVRTPDHAIGDRDPVNRLVKGEVRFHAPQGPRGCGDRQVFAGGAQIVHHGSHPEPPLRIGRAVVAAVAGPVRFRRHDAVQPAVARVETVETVVRGNQECAVRPFRQRGDHFRHRPGLVPPGLRVIAVQQRRHGNIQPVDRLLGGAPHDAFAEVITAVHRAADVKSSHMGCHRFRHCKRRLPASLDQTPPY